MGTLSRLVIALGLTVAAAIPQALASGPSAVAELFTSQGCSSCPPADRLVEQLSKNSDILALSLPVDYWDYLGWRDTLASPENSSRQRAYAASRGDRSVYTPQIVVNGREHIVGSDARALTAALDRAAPLSATVNLKMTDMAVEAEVTGNLPDGVRMATVFFLSVKESETVAVGRGENAGASITYANVVRSMQPIGMWSGGEETFRMPKSELMKSDGTQCAILVQLEGNTGPGAIIGAAMMNWAKSM